MMMTSGLMLLQKVISSPIWAYGRISRYGLVAFASSLDQIGPLTQNVEDAAVLLNALCGHDEKDSTSSTEPTTDFTAGLGQSIKGTRIGLPKEYLSDGNDPAVTAALQTAIAKLTEQGAEIVEISLPHAEAVVAAYYIIACAEASSNLSRFDGIRYGHRAEGTNGLEELHRKHRRNQVGYDCQRRGRDDTS